MEEPGLRRRLRDLRSHNKQLKRQLEEGEVARQANEKIIQQNSGNLRLSNDRLQALVAENARLRGLLTERDLAIQSGQTAAEQISEDLRLTRQQLQDARADNDRLRTFLVENGNSRQATQAGVPDTGTVRVGSEQLRDLEALVVRFIRVIHGVEIVDATTLRAAQQIAEELGLRTQRLRGLNREQS